MLAVTSAGPGVLEVNYMWLPSWIGMNSTLLQEMGEAVAAAVVGHPLAIAEVRGHEAVLAFLVGRYPEIRGLRDYLDALLKVNVHGQEED